jgi:hypothetical protein
MTNPLDPENLPHLISELLSQGYVTRRGVLSPGEIRAINSYFDENREHFKLNTVYQDKLLTVNTEVRGDYSIDVNLESPGTELAKVVQMVKNLEQKLRESGFEIKRRHLRPTYFPPLQFFKKHMDGHGTLLFTFVFYVNETCESRDRGNLVFYDQTNKIIADILPEPGSFMILLSRDVPHEVRICTRERRSILGMFYETAEVPEDP